MIGKQESNICPVCGGTLQENLATNPFILEPDTVVVIKDVPAEICSDCHERRPRHRPGDRFAAPITGAAQRSFGGGLRRNGSGLRRNHQHSK